MIITVASYKGGVGKTTTAVHLGAIFQADAPTLLIDGDANRSVLAWHQRGGLPMTVVDERQAVKYAPKYTHLIIDTQARPDAADLEALVDGCDLLILPTTPSALDLDALMLTVAALRKLGTTQYRVLVTKVPPKPSRDGEAVQSLLQTADIPTCATTIRRLVAFEKATAQGITVAQVEDPRADQGWQDYVNVAQEVRHAIAAAQK